LDHVWHAVYFKKCGSLIEELEIEETLIPKRKEKLVTA
jgi:hypothetical protein